MLVVSAMRFMADRTPLLECRLMQMRLLELIGLIGMTAKTDVDSIRLGQSRLRTGMWIVAVSAVASGSRMLNLCLLDQLSLVGVASDTKVLHVGLRQHHFAILRRRVTRCAAVFVGKRRMNDLRHQLRRSGLMWIVALEAIRRTKRLSLMRLDERFILHVMAIDAQRRNAFGQVLVELDLPSLTGLMCRVTGIAAHIERGVTTAFLGHVETLRVAIKAKILALLPATSLQQLVLILGNVRIVALDAVAYRWRMNCAFDRGRVFVTVTGQAESLRRRSGQLDASDVFVDANLVARSAAHLDCGMDRLALGLVLMTLEACLRVGIRLKRNWMHSSEAKGPAPHQEDQDKCKLLHALHRSFGLGKSVHVILQGECLHESDRFLTSIGQFRLPAKYLELNVSPGRNSVGRDCASCE